MFMVHDDYIHCRESVHVRNTINSFYSPLSKDLKVEKLFQSTQCAALLTPLKMVWTLLNPVIAADLTRLGAADVSSAFCFLWTTLLSVCFPASPLDFLYLSNMLAGSFSSPWSVNVIRNFLWATCVSFFFPPSSYDNTPSWFEILSWGRDFTLLPLARGFFCVPVGDGFLPFWILHLEASRAS